MQQSLPPDLRELLQFALPVTKCSPCTTVDPPEIIRSHKHFPDWRNASTKELAMLLAWPRNEILYDVHLGKFWSPAFGERPKKTSEAVAIAQRVLKNAPGLIPIYGHRFMPCISEANAPIYSVHQTDIIIYSKSLPTWASDEFDINRNTSLSDQSWAADLPEVPFWNNFIDFIWREI